VYPWKERKLGKGKSIHAPLGRKKHQNRKWRVGKSRQIPFARKKKNNCRASLQTKQQRGCPSHLAAESEKIRKREGKARPPTRKKKGRGAPSGEKGREKKRGNCPSQGLLRKKNRKKKPTGPTRSRQNRRKKKIGFERTPRQKRSAFQKALLRGKRGGEALLVADQKPGLKKGPSPLSAPREGDSKGKGDPSSNLELR